MKCTECNQNEAIFHYKANEFGKITEKHLCAECAEKEGNLTQSFFENNLFTPFFKNSMLDDFLGGMIEGGQKTSIRETNICPFCGMRYSELMKDGKTGCAKCYSTFRNVLNPTIQKIHGNVEHSGKIPNMHNEVNAKLEEIKSLKDNLQTAIEKQEYEEAAKLRDRIRDLEKEGEN